MRRRFINRVIMIFIIASSAYAVSGCAEPVTASAAAAPMGVIKGPFSTTNNLAAPRSIAAGPDGGLWFTESTSAEISHISTAGTITSTTLAANSDPYAIAQGPDGNMWFTQAAVGASAIGKITPAGVVTLFTVGLTAGAQPEGITAGPDGNLWFTEFSGRRIGRISTDGSISEYLLPVSSQPLGITTGPDGRIWFTDFGANKIGAISTSGAITEYAGLQGASPDLSRGPVS
jgi:streptogramin lyase